MTSTAHGRTAQRRRGSTLDRAVARGLTALERPEAPYLAALGGLFVAGLALRLNDLGRQSLWFDEADMVLLARQPLGALLRNLGAAGQNGPLYTLILHLWMLLFGTSEVAVRLPSVLAGAAAIPLIYALGRAIHGPRLGLYAAAILTVSPYQHWYAREAKMYALVVAATLASTLLLVLAVRDDARGRWIAYVIATTIALYLHVMAVLIVAAQAAWLLLRQRQAETPGRRRWIALAALTLPYLPIALWELRFIFGRGATWHRPIGLRDFLLVSFSHFTSGIRAGQATEICALLLFGALAMLGALPLAWRHGTWPVPFLALWPRTTLLVGLVAVPMVIFFLVTLLHPLFADRYLIVVTPALILLVAGGLVALERLAWPVAVGTLALVLAVSWLPLREVNLALTAQKEDWRSAYERIAAHAHPNDAVIVAPGYLQTTFEYYALRDQRLRTIPWLTVPTEYIDGSTDDRQLDLYLQQATAGYERVWLVLSPDRLADIDPFDRQSDCQPDRLRYWYCYYAHQIDERVLNGVWLGLYVYDRPFGTPFYPPPPIRLDRAIGDDLTLVGYGYDLAPGASAVPRGGTIPLILRWLFPKDRGGSYAIRWSLRDEGGRVVSKVGGNEPLFGGYAVRPWELARRADMWDYHDLPLPAGLPPGRYQVVIEATTAAQPGTTLPPGEIALGWVTVR